MHSLIYFSDKYMYVYVHMFLKTAQLILNYELQQTP